MVVVYLIAALVISITAVIFAMQNSAEVTVNLFFWTFNGSLSLILLITLLIGILIGTLVLLPGAIRRRFQVSGLKKKMDQLRDKKHENTNEENMTKATTSESNQEKQSKG